MLNSSLLVTSFSLLALVTLALSVYLTSLVLKLKKEKLKENEQKKQLEKQLADKNQYYLESIRTIALAYTQGQCDVSEACIRIKKLLENFPELESLEELDVLQSMYKEVSDFPTHEERLKQSKQVIFNQDKLRYTIEKKYEKEINSALLFLLERINKS